MEVVYITKEGNEMSNSVKKRSNEYPFSVTTSLSEADYYRLEDLVNKKRVERFQRTGITHYTKSEILRDIIVDGINRMESVGAPAEQAHANIEDAVTRIISKMMMKKA